jgi:hypothetical protein
VPYEYLMRLGDRLSAPALSPDSQLELLDQLRRDLEVENDDRARADLRNLLITLRNRNDVTHRTANEVEKVLAASVPGAPAREMSAASVTPAPADLGRPQQPDFSQPSPTAYAPSPQPSPSAYAPFQQPSMPPPPVVMAPAWGPGPVPTPAPRKGATLSVIAFVLGTIAILFIPILFGGAGIVCAAVGLARKQKAALPALIYSILTTIVGIILGAAAGMSYSGY